MPALLARSISACRGSALIRPTCFATSSRTGSTSKQTFRFAWRTRTERFRVQCNSEIFSLTGPVGSLVFGFGTAGHPILQTARIPLAAFGNSAIVSNLRGVRFTFDDTRRDEIYLANIQLSKLNGLLAPLLIISTLPTADTVVDTANGGGNDVNQIKSIRSVQSATLGNAVEIELSSNREFLPQGEMLVLRIGSQEFNLSRYPTTGETNALVFTLTAEEFARISQGDPVHVQYGNGPNYNGWNFGKVDKTMLGR